MITADSGANAALNSTVRGMAFLVEIDFASGTQRFTDWPINISSGGFTYLGLGDLVSVSQLTESEDPKPDKITLKVSIVNSAMLAALIGPATEYRGKAVRITAQAIGEDEQPAGAKLPRWSGKIDKISIVRTAAKKAGAPVGSIEIYCQRNAGAGLRSDQGLRLTHEQQQQRFPGDNGLEYVQTLIEKPTLWLSKRFQEAGL